MTSLLRKAVTVLPKILSFKQNSFYSTYFPLLSDKKTKKNDTKIGYSTFSYLNQLENNLLIYEAKIGSDEQLFKVILDNSLSFSNALGSLKYK